MRNSLDVTKDSGKITPAELSEKLRKYELMYDPESEVSIPVPLLMELSNLVSVVADAESKQVVNFHPEVKDGQPTGKERAVGSRQVTQLGYFAEQIMSKLSSLCMNHYEQGSLLTQEEYKKKYPPVEDVEKTDPM